MAEENEQVSNDLAEKIRLEVFLVNESLKLFNKLNRENSQSIAETGLPIDAKGQSEEWENALDSHYKKVQNSFVGRVSETLPDEDEEMSASELAIILAALAEWREDKKKKVASQIVETNASQINDSFVKSRELLAETGEEVTNRDVAATSATLFKRKFKPRSNMIAMTETQGAAESTKLVEAGVLSGMDSQQILRPVAVPEAVLESVKVWRDFGDDLVRDIHKAINGVRKKLNQAFESGGELLMHPGDTSLGASMKNIANCRCELDYKIKRVER